LGQESPVGFQRGRNGPSRTRLPGSDLARKFVSRRVPFTLPGEVSLVLGIYGTGPKWRVQDGEVIGLEVARENKGSRKNFRGGRNI